MGHSNLKINIGDWVVTNDGRTVEITMDDMPDLNYEDISRLATPAEVRQANYDRLMGRIAARNPTVPMPHPPSSISECLVPMFTKERNFDFSKFDKPVRMSTGHGHAPEIPPGSYMCTKWGNDRLDITKDPKSTWKEVFELILKEL